MTYFCNILQGDALEVLKTLESESVQCCVTSPPYFGLRDYGTAEWDISNAEDAEIAEKCDHKGDERFYSMQGASSVTSEAFSEAGEANADRLKKARWREKGTCIHCGAVRIDAQIGLEATPAEFVGRLVEVFEEVRRVLKKDGTLWLNLGDSYFGGGYSNHDINGESWKDRMNGDKRSSRQQDIKRNNPGIKPKDLVGIPWRVAFALQADGWYLRQDIIWAKPNPMPESVTDRCTKSHEYIFLLTKSAKYFYDNEAIKQPVAESTIGRGPVDFGGAKGRQYKADIAETDPNYRNGTEQWGRTFDYTESSINGCNKRSVWTVATQPYSEAHFATFPPKLIEPCILAGSREGDTVLDPFNGAGTTGLVSLRHRRNYIGIELNPEYIKIAEKRLSDVQVKLF